MCFDTKIPWQTPLDIIFTAVHETCNNIFLVRIYAQKYEIGKSLDNSLHIY